MAKKKKAPDANDLATMRLQAMQQAVQAGRQVAPSAPATIAPRATLPVGGTSPVDTSAFTAAEQRIYGSAASQPVVPAPVTTAATTTVATTTSPSTTAITTPFPAGSPVPGPTGTPVAGERTLARDTFINTLALLIGREEAGKEYVKKLYDLAAPYYRTGSTIDEAMNLALREAQLNNAIPEFTKRFRAIKALEDMRRQGVPVEVPTIAEFVKSQEALADVLKIAGLKDLANEDFLNDVMSTGKSVRETSAIINDVFNAIDFAPEPVKAEIRRNLPFADRTTLAKAILTGERGVRELEQMRTRSEVKAAAAQAGLSLADAAAQELANSGFNFKTSLPRFGQVRQTSERGTFLAGLSGQAPVTQEQAIGAVFNQAANELETLGKIEERERLRFQGRSGAVKLASQARGNRGAF